MRMSASKIANEIESVVSGELDDCERAIKRNDERRALSELDDAMTKLRDLARKVRRLG
jgi:hypothetical protein